MKRKLLLAAMLVVGALGFKANAQDVDYTDRITNANMASKEGWTLTKTGTRDWSDIEGSEPSYVIEAYAGWGSIEMSAYAIKQSVTLPSGKYRAEGYAFYRYGLNADTDPTKSYAYLVAGDFKAKVVTLGGETLDETLTAFPNSTGEASVAFTNGYYKSTIEFSVETESDIEFGYEGTHVLKQSWFICGPIKLYRTGDFDYSLYIQKLNDKVEEAEALYDADIPAAAKAALQGVVDEKKAGTYSTVAEYNAACDAIDAAIDEYASDAILAACAAWLEWKGKAEAIAAVASDNADALATFNAAISTQNTAFDAATTVAAITTATADLKDAMTTYVYAASPANRGDKFDITFLLTNPDLTGFPTWQPAEGWVTEQADGNSQVMVNDSKTNGEYSYFYEYWSDPAKDNALFNLYTAVNLPLGTYSMTCYAFAEDQYTSATVPAVFFYANDTQGSNVNSSILTEQSIKFNNILDETETEKEVKIGLKPLEGNTCNWMGIGYVKLYKEFANTTFYDIAVDDEKPDALDVNVATSSLALETVTVTVATESENGYTVKVTGESGESVDVANPSAGTYTFQMPEENVTVSAFFTPTITLYDGESVVEDPIIVTSGTITFTAGITPDVAPQDVVWSSSDESIATVEDGVVTPISSGTVTITAASAADATRYAEAVVTVDFPETAFPGYVNDGAVRTVYTLGENLIKNGSFEYANPFYGWTSGTGEALTSDNFDIVEEDDGNHYLKAKKDKGQADAGSIYTSWAVEEGKTYRFSFSVKNSSAVDNDTYIRPSLSATTSEDADSYEADFSPAVSFTTAWKTYAYTFTVPEGKNYLVFSARWLKSTKSFDNFMLAEMLAEPTVVGNLDYITDNVPTENIGDQLFYYSQENIADAMSYVANTAPEDATVDDVEWLYDLMMEVNKPIEGWPYSIDNTTAEGALNFAGESVTVGDDAGVYFTAVDGGYVLSNADGEYLFKTTNNDWTFSTTEDISKAYVVNFNIVGDGEYTIQGAKGLVGTNSAETAAGSPVYANKTTADGNCVWTITAYPFIIDEDADYDYTLNDDAWDGATFDVVLYRTIKEGINTIVLPFSMSQEEVEETFGEGSKVYIVDEFDGESNIRFMEIDGIWDNVPCLLKATEASGDEPYIIENRTLYSIPDAGVATGYAYNLSFIGTYAASTDVENDDNNFILYNGDFYLVDTDGVTVKNTRAYFHVDSEAPIKALNFIFGDEEATAIAGIGAKKAVNEATYNVAGQRVGAAYKGIVIKNGKKYLQK